MTPRTPFALGADAKHLKTWSAKYDYVTVK